MKKNSVLLLSVIIVLSLTVSGCSKQKSTASATPNAAVEKTAASTAAEPAAEKNRELLNKLNSTMDYINVNKDHLNIDILIVMSSKTGKVNNIIMKTAISVKTQRKDGKLQGIETSAFSMQGKEIKTTNYFDGTYLYSDDGITKTKTAFNEEHFIALANQYNMSGEAPLTSDMIKSAETAMVDGNTVYTVVTDAVKMQKFVFNGLQSLLGTEPIQFNEITYILTMTQDNKPVTVQVTMDMTAAASENDTDAKANTMNMSMTFHAPEAFALPANLGDYTEAAGD